MAYKFQIGAAKLAGAVESTGQIKGVSLDASEGNVSNVGALTADTIGKDDGASELGLVDDLRAATNKQLQFRAATQKIFSPSADQLAIEASASVQFDINLTGALSMNASDVTVMNKALFLSGASGKMRYQASAMTAGKLLVSDGTDFESVAMSGDISIVANGATSIGNDKVGVDMLKSSEYARGGMIRGDASGDPKVFALGAANRVLMSDGSDLIYSTVPNAALANQAVTVVAGDGLQGGGSVNLGASITLDFDASDIADTGIEANGENLRLAAQGNGIAGGAGSVLSLDLDGASSGLALAVGGVKVDLSSSNALILDAGGLDLKATIAGPRVFTGDVTFEGSVFSASVGTLKIEDNNIVIRDGGAPADGAGITIGTTGSPVTLQMADSAANLACSVPLKATSFIGALNGNANTATVGTTVTVTDNESTAEENLISFVAGAATATGNHGLEMDGNLTYNPSLGRVSATAFLGDGSALTGVTATGTARLIEAVNGGANVTVNNAMMGKIIVFTADVSNGGSGREIILPASDNANIGKSILVKCTNAAAEPITVNRATNSQAIDGANANIVLQSDSAAVELIYVAAGSWIIV